MKNSKKVTIIISIIIIIFLFIIILLFYNNSKNNNKVDSYENNEILKTMLQESLSNKFPGRNIDLDKVIQVEEYAAASWSSINSGGICLFVNNNNNWQILKFGGGYPDSKYLVSEFGMSTNTAESLLDGVLTNWRNVQNSNNNLETINNSNPQQSGQLANNNEVLSSPYIIPLSLLDKLKINENNPNISYYYSSQNKIAFTYEIKSIDNKKAISVTEGQPDTGDEEKIYLFFTEKDNIQSGQSIEIININETLRFRDIPSIIREQILIADEKQGCSIEEKNGRYTIKPKTNTQTCGNYAGVDNRFFVKPTEDVFAISKLIFVNAGNQELSYDGSLKGKYWYESVIVE